MQAAKICSRIAEVQVGRAHYLWNTDFWCVRKISLFCLDHRAQTVGKPHAKAVPAEYKAMVAKRAPETWPVLVMSMMPKAKENSGVYVNLSYQERK